MKRTIFCFLALILSTLACLSPSAAAVVATGNPTPDLAIDTVPPPVGAGELVDLAPVGVAERCAKVIAAASLHLRSDATEHSRSLAFLVHGQMVQLISDLDPDWWLLENAGVVGYARSKYLELTACP